MWVESGQGAVDPSGLVRIPNSHVDSGNRLAGRHVLAGSACDGTDIDACARDQICQANEVQGQVSQGRDGARSKRWVKPGMCGDSPHLDVEKPDALSCRLERAVGAGLEDEHGS